MVVVWKDLEESDGQGQLFNRCRCFFYITNIQKVPAEKIVLKANGRCNQENVIEQLKNGVRGLTSQLRVSLSNWAYMVMASLAWTLKAWAAPLLPEEGRWSKRRQEEKQTLLRMDFGTFRQAMISIPAQIIRGSRQIVYRLLSDRWQPVFFRLLDQLALPLPPTTHPRCRSTYAPVCRVRRETTPTPMQQRQLNQLLSSQLLPRWRECCSLTANRDCGSLVLGMMQLVPKCLPVPPPTQCNQPTLILPSV